MEEIRTAGIVTRTVDFRDYDRMITLLSPTHGRIELCLKGCRKPNARLRAAGQMFCFADFELTSSRPGHYVMTGCTVRDSFFDLAADLDRFRAAAKLCNLTNTLYDAQQDVREELFSLLLSTITTLAYAPRIRPEEINLLFALRLLPICGYEPQMESCVECGAPVPHETYAFQSVLGGALCPDCAQRIGHTELSLGAVSSMKLAMELSPSQFATFHFSNAVYRELRPAIGAFLSARLEETE